MSLPKFNLSKLRESVSRQQSVTKKDIRNLLLLDRLQAQIRNQSRANEKKYKSEGSILYFVISFDPIPDNKNYYLAEDYELPAVNFNEDPIDAQVRKNTGEATKGDSYIVGTVLYDALRYIDGDRGTPILELTKINHIKVNRHTEYGKNHVTYKVDLDEMYEWYDEDDEEIDHENPMPKLKEITKEAVEDFVRIAGNFISYKDGEEFKYIDIGCRIL